jgi:hypothetical protein
MNMVRRVLLVMYVSVFFSALSVAQTQPQADEVSVYNVDDSMKGWKPVCVLPRCNPGGSGIHIKTSQNAGHLSPSVDGGSMKVSVTGRSYTNALWTYVAGRDDSATSFSMKLWVYPTNQASVAGSYEFDQFDFSSSTGVEFMWGTQCNQVNHLWQVFDQLHGHWMNTSVPCALAANQWHHVHWEVHRVAGDTDRCSGMPCMYYDTLVVDGTMYAVNMKYPAGHLPGGWSSSVGFQVQIDIGATGSPATVEQFIDMADFTAM